MFAQEDRSPEDSEAVWDEAPPCLVCCGRKVWCPSPPSKVLGLGVPQTLEDPGEKLVGSPGVESHMKSEMGPRNLTPSHLPGWRHEVSVDKVWVLRPDLKVFVPAVTRPRLDTAFKSLR